MSDSNQSHNQFEGLFSDSGVPQASASEIEALRSQVADLQAANSRAQSAVSQERLRRESLEDELSALREQVGVRQDDAPSPETPFPLSGAISLSDRVRRWMIPPVFDNSEKNRVANLMTIILPALIGLMVLWLLIGFSQPDTTQATRMTMFTGLIVFSGLWFALKRGRVRSGAAVLIFMLYSLITQQAHTVSQVSPVTIAMYLLLVVITGMLFIDYRVIAICIVLSWLSIIVAHYIEVDTAQANGLPGPTTAQLLVYLVTLGLVGIILHLSHRTIRESYQSALHNERLLTDSNQRLQHIRENLETRINERTRDLLLANEIAHAISVELNPERLMNHSVNMIRHQFGFNYVGLFLVDEVGQVAELRAGTGQAGQALLAAKHSLIIGGNSMIGDAIVGRRPRIAADVRSESTFFANPHLPNTRSEMALPLIVQDKVLGALTIQSNAINAFSESDIAAMQDIVDLIALALNNAQRFQQAQAAWHEMEEERRQQVSDIWDSYAQQTRSTYLEPVNIPGLSDVLNKGTPALVNVGDAQALTAPLQLRNEVIGALSLEGDPSQWSEDELALVQAVADQAALALDNVRLIDETRRLAQRERLINEISDNLRQSPDLETIVKATLRELSRALKVTNVSIRMGTEVELLDDTTTINGSS